MLTPFSLQPSCNRILRCCVCEGLPVTGSKAVVGSKVLESCDHEDERQEVLVVVDAAGGSRIAVLDAGSDCDEDEEEEHSTVNLDGNPVPIEHVGGIATKTSSWRIDEPVGESPLPSLPVPTTSPGPLLPPEDDFGGFHEVGTLDDFEDSDSSNNHSNKYYNFNYSYNSDEDLESLQRRSSQWREQWRAQQLAAAAYSQAPAAARASARQHRQHSKEVQRSLREEHFGSQEHQQERQRQQRQQQPQSQQQQQEQQRRWELQEQARRCFVEEMQQAQHLHQRLLQKVEMQKRSRQDEAQKRGEEGEEKQGAGKDDEEEEADDEEEDLHRGLASGQILHQKNLGVWNRLEDNIEEEEVLQQSLAEIQAEDYRQGLSQQAHRRQLHERHHHHHHHSHNHSSEWWHRHVEPEDEQMKALKDDQQLTPRLCEEEAQSMQKFLKAIAEVAVNSVDRDSISCGSDRDAEEVHLPRSYGLAASRERLRRKGQGLGPTAV